MNAENPRPRFVVLVDGLARYWGASRDDAQARYDRALARHREEKNPLFDPDAEMCVEEIGDRVFYCPTHNRELLFQARGWVGCPECGRVWLL